jgi:hypothetical protein
MRGEETISRHQSRNYMNVVFENFTASIVDLMVANIRLLAPLTCRRDIFKYNNA